MTAEERELFRYRLPEVSLCAAAPGKRMSSRMVCNRKDAEEFITSFLTGALVENVVLLTLGTDLRPINWSVVAKGDLFQTFVSVPEIARTCILSAGCCGCIVYHNHSSVRQADGSAPRPSQPDIQICTRIYHSLELLGMELFDFIIIGPDRSSYSFRQAGMGPYEKIA